MKHNIYCLGVAILMAILVIPAVQASASGQVNGTFLEITDSTESVTAYPFEKVVFAATYFNVSGTSEPITDGVCRMTYQNGKEFGWTSMSYNSSLGTYVLELEDLAYVGDWYWTVRCEAEGFETIELRDLFTITAPPNWDRGVDVYGLDMEGSTLKAKIRNTGNWKDLVAYSIYVNDNKTHSAEVVLEPGEEAQIEYGYDGFDDGTYGGEYTMRIDAFAASGASDSEQMSHQVEVLYSCRNPLGIEDEQRCDLQNKRLMECNSGSWEIVEEENYAYCTACNDRSWCSARYDKDTWEGCGEEEGCGLEITDFEYSNHMLEGMSGTVTVTAKNTGIDEERLYIRFYLDGEVAQFKKVDVDNGESVTKDFTYFPRPGWHTIRIVVETDCGVMKQNGAQVYTYERVQQSWADVEPREEALETKVSVSPESIDIPLYDAGVIAIRAETEEPQVFTVEVTGVPENWLSYPLELNVERRDTSYIYLTPKDMGTYQVTVTVKALDDGTEFEQVIDVYVAEPNPEQENPGMTALRTVKGSFGYIFGDSTVFFGLMVVFLLVIIGAGFRHLREPDIWDQ